jgi:hypothetical protein
MDAATIVRTLGAKLLELYAAATPETDAEQERGTEQERSGWGTKQREKLLLALLEQIATNAQRHENAALSATDAAIERFSRTKFKEGVTRSRRDRAPITKNIDKLVGGWLRQLGRRLKQDAVVVAVTDDVELRDRHGKFRLTLNLRYPWRLITNRRLIITTQFEQLSPGDAPRPLPFKADPKASEVALPEHRRSYSPNEVKHVEHLLRALQLAAEMSKNDELAEYADRGLFMFVPKSGAKILVATFLSLIAFTTVAGAVDWFKQWMNAYRLLPALTSQCDPAPSVILRFPQAPEGGVRVEKNGTPLPMKDGIAIDNAPVVGARNTYTVRPVRSLLLPYIAHISFEMPVCPSKTVSSCPTCVGPDASFVETGRTGTFNLTVDKTGLGDPPSALPASGPLPLDPGHMDEHLDPFVRSSCADDACQVVQFRCYFGPVDGADVQVTVNHGDGGTLSVLHTADAVTAAKQQLTVDYTKPVLVKAKTLGTAGDNYSLFAIHYYSKPGSYIVTATVGARSRADEPYHFVKQLQRLVRVGTVATIEMTESYRLPEHHAVPAPDAHSQ